MGPINRPLELEWLEDFLALVDSGNFSRAAQARSIAQPALSRHIRALEEWVGVELVDRSRHPATTTPAGEVFLLSAKTVLASLVLARTQAHEAQSQSNSRLQFAATHALSLNFFPRWLQGIEQKLKLGAIFMVSDSYRACEDLFLQQGVQFLLYHDHPALPSKLRGPEFEFLHLGDDKLVPVSATNSQGHLLHQLESEQVSILAYSLESGLGQIVQAQLGIALSAARFKRVFTAHHAVLLKTLALEGRGIAWLPQSLVQEELALGRLQMAGTEKWRVDVAIRLVRSTNPLNMAAMALWETHPKTV
ncbi:HTH-type transcriptional regulator YjiE [Polaromonas vacuolata]|uniref:HTH-type transcriptional regulator YjiE n=1 Tax=Polaromonas vacuolata TaxID=37448 RepID=A0A6H2H8U5_9BURK|nr:LysR family transcriptional regulator [Polaromonas vacuolata]QJC56301.1 HTH-type transcriptional regulator YjiE [Polaromonas vacuolata]